ncbi:hypothetical protein BDP27DRAFT_1416559 [Rhodocollybia butyracea]|uniref:F-box domain-containing protein n=1 Tax=Rhodocollybia butyracea TaxID=206335 RepID=A0A9P5Q393_9AGAR|nr:hypothetical protein BDP27DRAFT_1416559 [Rhodocollybia butyracea]
MSLKTLVDTRPSSHSLDTSLSPSYGCSTISTFSSGVRYIQRALLGFDSSNPYASLAVTGFKRLSLAESKCYINYLPVELLREIFMLCLPYERWTLPMSAFTLRPLYPPRQLILSQVCSYWRRVALCFPDLWSTITIISPALYHIPMVKLWLERSRQLPLTLYINGHNYFNGQSESRDWEKACTSITVIEDVINLLRPHVRRWKSITFILSPPLSPHHPWVVTLPPGCLSLLESLISLPSDCFSLLEVVHFDVGGHFAIRYFEMIMQIRDMFLSSSNQLKEVEWKTKDCIHRALSFPINLTHLSGDFALDMSFFNGLSQLKNLRCLRLSGDSRWDRFPLQPPLTLYHLHTLDLRATEFAPPLLNLIDTPNLKVLAIGNHLTDDDYPVLLSFLARCRCDLTAFSYFDFSGESSDLGFWKDLFSSPHVGSLSELNVESRNADALLTVLSWTNPDRPILPLLNRLWIRTFRCSVGPLFDMIEYRVHHFQPPSGPALSEGLFDGFATFLPSAERSLCIRTDYLQNNDSHTLAELNKLIERNASGHRVISVPSIITTWY